MSKLTKLTLVAYDANKNKVGKTFTVMINPETITEMKKINYSDCGVSSANEKFLGYDISVISIPDILLDTTGAIPREEWPNNRTTIIDMLSDLKSAIYEYDGREHQPSVVQVQWGPFLYYTRLRSLDIKYTLFNREGKPVRALVTLNFVLYETEKETEAKAGKQSPDLTHYVEVKAGDSLPLMCERIYKNPFLYMQVAKANGLTNFRNLKPGSRLYFPPLVD